MGQVKFCSTCPTGQVDLKSKCHALTCTCMLVSQYVYMRHVIIVFNVICRSNVLTCLWTCLQPDWFWKQKLKYYRIFFQEYQKHHLNMKPDDYIVEINKMICVGISYQTFLRFVASSTFQQHARWHASATMFTISWSNCYWHQLSSAVQPLFSVLQLYFAKDEDEIQNRTTLLISLRTVLRTQPMRYGEHRAWSTSSQSIMGASTD